MSFNNDLAFSEDPSLEPYLNSVYEHYFPNLVQSVRLSGDTDGQRLGHDRLLYLADGKVLLIDEKLDRTTYPNFVMEFVSNDRAPDYVHRRGWLEKPLLIDYILYVYVAYPRRAYLLPWQDLRRAWECHKGDWLDRFGTRQVMNQGYASIICPVPRSIVLEALLHGMIWKGD